MNKARPQHLVTGVLILVISSVAFYMTFSMPDVDAYRFPRMVTILFFTLGVAFVVATLKGKYDSADNNAPIQFLKLKVPCISYLMVIAYIALITTIGFYTSTFIFLIVFMRFLGAKSWIKIVVTTICVVIFIYALFSIQFRVPLPMGIAI